jgi:hypothetical protein
MSRLTTIFGRNTARKDRRIPIFAATGIEEKEWNYLRQKKNGARFELDNL